MVTRVIIVRHGQSSYNALQKIQGRCDESVLTEKGIFDAKSVGQVLKNITLDGIYSSPLQRAKATAVVIQSAWEHPPEIIVSEQLMEVDLPLWEKLVKSEVKERFPEEYKTWQTHPQQFKMILEGGREHYPVLSLYEQARQFWQATLTKHQGKTILIVAHNGINRCLILSAIGISPDYYHAIQQSNCCINILNFVGDLGDAVQLESLNQTAHLGMPLPPPRPDHQSLRLLLVRHGETQWNRESRFQGIRDIPLNENGQRQAQKAADFLKDIPIDFAISSPLLRPKETAEIILQYHLGIDLELVPDLMEICHGLWEGKLESEIEKDFPGLLQAWKDMPEKVQMPEGENLQQVWDRAIAAWDKIVEKYANPQAPLTVIVVAHDAINKVILCHLMGLKPDNIWNIKQGNGAVSVIDYAKNTETKPVLQAINLTFHLGAGVLDTTAAGAL